MRFTAIHNENGNLAKTLKADGSKESGAVLYRGKYMQVESNSLQEFNNMLNELEQKEAILLGVTSAEKGHLVTIDALKKSSHQNNIISRSKEYISFENEAYLLFDIDTDEGKNVECKSYDELLEILYKLDPQFEKAEILIRPSSSSYIYKWEKGTKTLIKGAGSYHIYVKAKNVDTHLSTYIKTLIEKAFELEYGYYKVSKSGATLKRQVFDSAVFSPERLVFEAGMICEEPYEQELPEAYYCEGGYIDCLQVPKVNSLIVKEKIISAEKDVEVEAKETKEKFTSKHIKAYMDSGYSEKEAKEAVFNMINNSTLCSEHSILLDSGTLITVSDIFIEPEKYDGQTCHDPIDENKGKNKAIIYTNKGLTPIIKSFAHGETRYKLEADFSTIYKIANGISSNPILNEDLVNKIKKLSTTASLSDEERKQIAKVLKGKNILFSLSELNLTPKELQEENEEKGYKDFNSKGKILPTIDNLKVLLKNNNMDYTYDVILKNPEFNYEKIDNNAPNIEDAILSEIEAFAYREEIDPNITKHISALANSEYSNGLMDFVRESHKTYKENFDNIDYIKKFAKCLTADKVSDTYIKEILVKWMVQCIASWDYDRTTPREDAKDKYESVLVFQGGQGLNKTKLISCLLPKNYEKYIKTGALLNPSDKDSLMQTTAYAIVELGELESTFNKSDIGALKAFLSNGVDEYRAPYGKTASKHKRCTSFCGSVNERGFLRDPTGARRFWVIPLIEIDFITFDKIDKAQMWAQAYDLYMDGEKWWFDSSDATILGEIEKIHEEHKAYSLAEEVLFDIRNRNGSPMKLNVSEIFDNFDKKATKADKNELSTVLEKNGYQRDARKKFIVPLGLIPKLTSNHKELDALMNVM